MLGQLWVQMLDIVSGVGGEERRKNNRVLAGQQYYDGKAVIFNAVLVQKNIHRAGFEAHNTFI